MKALQQMKRQLTKQYRNQKSQLRISFFVGGATRLRERHSLTQHRCVEHKVLWNRRVIKDVVRRDSLQLNKLGIA